MLQYQAPLEGFNFLAHRVVRRPELLPLPAERRHIGADLFKDAQQGSSERQEDCQ